MTIKETLEKMADRLANPANAYLGPMTALEIRELLPLLDAGVSDAEDDTLIQEWVDRIYPSTNNSTPSVKVKKETKVMIRTVRDRTLLAKAQQGGYREAVDKVLGACVIKWGYHERPTCRICNDLPETLEHQPDCPIGRLADLHVKEKLAALHPVPLSNLTQDEKWLKQKAQQMRKDWTVLRGKL